MKKIVLTLTTLFVVSVISGCSYSSNTPAPLTTGEPLISIPSEPAVPASEAPAQPESSSPSNAPESVITDLPKGVSLETMTDAEKREVNLFLSNFSETSYKRSTTTDEEDMLYFVFMHNIINNKNFKNYVYGNEYRISADLVDKNLNRFFGFTLPHSEPAGTEWWYKDGYFCTAAADMGETVTYFTSAKELTDNVSGTYTVQFDVFRSFEPADSSWYSLSHEEASSRFDRVYSGMALIRPKTDHSGPTYELVAYDVE